MGLRDAHEYSILLGGPSVRSSHSSSNPWTPIRERNIPLQLLRSVLTLHGCSDKLAFLFRMSP
jgi:hypothetical protein